MNLLLSKLSFDLQIPTQTLTKFNNIYGNALALIDRITLTSRSGVILADIPNTHIFGSLVSSVNTKMQDLLTRNTTSYVLPAGATTDPVTAGLDAASQLGAYTAAQASRYSDTKLADPEFKQKLDVRAKQAREKQETINKHQEETPKKDPEERKSKEYKKKKTIEEK